MLFDQINSGKESINVGGDAIKIKAKLLSPLLQINFGSNKTYTETKKVYTRVKGLDYPIALPVYTANGMRGTLRRLALKSIDDIAKEVDPFYAKTLSAKTINFYASGNEKTVEAISSLKYNETEAIRTIMAPIGLFGAGLSFIEGKLAISSLEIDKENAVAEKKSEDSDEVVTKAAHFIGRLSGVRFDETTRKSMLTPMINAKSVEEWLKLNSDNSKDTKRKKALEKQKTLSEKEQKELDELKDIKNTSTQMLHEHEYVVPGTELFGSINTKRGFTDMTEVEKGMMFTVLYELSLSQLGSLKNKGYGVVDWVISLADYGDIVTKTDPLYYLDKKEVQVSDKIKDAMEKYRDWIVKNRVWEYLEVDKLFEKAKKEVA